ncbi:MAG: SdiA-regulated domain-containing protein [Cryomorphaceae bacterium]|nr:SdiA-regulated domain-containing protein [Cryomorphaceae bacterium]
MHVLLIILATFIWSSPPKLKPLGYINIEVPEPSDIAVNPLKDNSYFVVSDDGYLFEMNENGKITRKADFYGNDCEGVHADSNYVYVVEEFTRKIRVFDIHTFKLERTLVFPYSGGRNKGYESLTYNPVRKVFVMLTEKDPIYLLELDENLRLINEHYMEGIAGDISAATFYDNHIWLLSDEDMHVIKLNPQTYEEVGRWYIPVINPEGICFDNGQMLIVSDDMERLYRFPIPQ